MTLTSDLEVLKDIPGYKPILKAVLKSQIQFLVEQLSDHTGEESVLLTASVAEGSLSHLGSNTGRHFIEGHDDVKAMFLTYCLKNGQMDDDDMPVKTKTTPSRLIALAKRSPATPGTSSIQPDNRKRKPGAPIVMETSSPKTMKLAPTGDYPGEDDGDDHVELEEDEGDQGSGEGATGPATQTKRTAKPFKPRLSQSMATPEINGHRLTRIETDGHYGKRTRRSCGVCNPAEREELAKIGIVKKRPGRESSYECSKCRLTLCQYPCFQIFHKNKDFKKAYHEFKKQLEYDKKGVYSDDSDQFGEDEDIKCEFDAN